MGRSHAMPGHAVRPNHITIHPPIPTPEPHTTTQPQGPDAAARLALASCPELPAVGLFLWAHRATLKLGGLDGARVRICVVVSCRVGVCGCGCVRITGAFDVLMCGTSRSRSRGRFHLILPPHTTQKNTAAGVHFEPRRPRDGFVGPDPLLAPRPGVCDTKPAVVPLERKATEQEPPPLQLTLSPIIIHQFTSRLLLRPHQLRRLALCKPHQGVLPFPCVVFCLCAVCRRRDICHTADDFTMHTPTKTTIRIHPPTN